MENLIKFLEDKITDKMSRTCGHTHKKQTDFSLKIGMGGEAILGLCYLPDK